MTKDYKVELDEQLDILQIAVVRTFGPPLTSCVSTNGVYLKQPSLVATKIPTITSMVSLRRYDWMKTRN